MPEWLTPPQIAKQRQLRVGKVLAWIRSGELRAVNCAEIHGSRTTTGCGPNVNAGGWAGVV